MPVPVWFSVPEPLMLPESVCTFAPVFTPFTAPLSVTLFVKVSPFSNWIARTPPTFTVVVTEFTMDAPAATPLPICSVPAATVVGPLYVFAAVRIVVPAPFCVSSPPPLMTPESVCVPAVLLPITEPPALFVTGFPKMPPVARLIPSVAPLFTTTVAVLLPILVVASEPSPTCSVPPFTFVCPRYVLAPVTVKVPEPIFVSGFAATPPMMPASEELNAPVSIVPPPVFSVTARLPSVTPAVV